MEPLRLLFGLLFAVMSVGVLVFPVTWPFSKNDTALSNNAEVISETEIYAEADSSLVNLDEIPTDTVLSVRPITLEEGVTGNLADQLSMARYLAAEEKFDDALDVLSKLSVYEQDKYEVVFLRAQILSWAGRHQAADLKYQRLMAKYPGNTDLMLSYGYLQYYQGEVAEAEKMFLEVLKVHPDYKDAQDGLVKVREAM